MEITLKGHPQKLAQELIDSARSGAKQGSSKAEREPDNKKAGAKAEGNTLKEQAELYNSFLEKQAAADKLQRTFTFMSEMLKKAHETMMAIIRNI